MVAEVLELDEGVLSVPPHHGIHELVNEVVIGLPGHAIVTEPNVVDVLKHLDIKQLHLAARLFDSNLVFSFALIWIL